MRDALGSVQSVLVLGGTSEIALATVRALLDERTRTVVLAVRDPEGARDVVESLRAGRSTHVEAVAFDALRGEEHQALVDEIFDRHGDFDVVLLAFGVLGDQAESERDPAAARRVVETNFTGAVSVSVPIAQRLRAQGHGTLVVLSSVAGERARKANFVYGASKAGLDAFAQGLGDSLAGSGAHVMVVRPGFVQTKMTTDMDAAPLATTPDAVAQAVVAGLRRNAHTVWVPGALRGVMAVLRHLPRGVFRRIPG
ncbi:MAG: decaprenylphospho-beta-D-erythro-pentofuranosid-2-ulose 2-reductase [Actinomycetota bacterium]|nr:decaprenylphospho-beta-D-erythro-pentofuranosid-2-ulose 2-reductase [Actinomycetota bacterium]